MPETLLSVTPPGAVVPAWEGVNVAIIAGIIIGLINFLVTKIVEDTK